MFSKRRIALLPLACVLFASSVQATMVKRMDPTQSAWDDFGFTGDGDTDPTFGVGRYVIDARTF